MIKVKSILFSNILILFVTAILILITYSNGLKGDFVSDDIPGILENETTKNLNSAISKSSIQPIILSLIYNTFGPNPIPFHTASLILHIVNTVLFFLIAYILFDKKIATMATPLFAVHPIGSEAVLWISALNYLLNAFFIFSCLILFLIYKKNDSKKHLYAMYVYYFVILLFFTNPWIYTFPFLLTGIDFFFFEKRLNKKALLILSVVFLIAAGDFIYLTKLSKNNAVEKRVESIDSYTTAPYKERVLYATYMTSELLIFPKNITFYHEGEQISKAKWTFMTYYSIFLTVFLIITLVNKKKYEYIGLVFLIYLSVIILYSPIQVAWQIADRYLYIASGLFSILLVKILIYLDSKVKDLNASFAILTTILVLIFYIISSFSRTIDWKTNKNLWLSTLEVGPYGPKVHNNLGDIYFKERNWQQAIIHFRNSVELNSNYAEAMHNLANAYYMSGDKASAYEWYNRALSINPNIAHSYFMLGVISYDLGNMDNSIKFMQKALELEPTFDAAKQSIEQIKNLNN